VLKATIYDGSSDGPISLKKRGLYAKKVSMAIFFYYHFLFVLFLCQWMDGLFAHNQHYRLGPTALKSYPARPAKIRNRYGPVE
jgi:hypothetical protein